jgi:hypothetical protein
VTPEAGAFRVEAYAEPASPALAFYAAAPPPAPPAKAAQREDMGVALSLPNEADKTKDELQGLVERFQKEGRVSRVAGALPVQVPFPSLGPSVFLVSELTAEGKAPAIDLGYAQTTKGGGR